MSKFQLKSSILIALSLSFIISCSNDIDGKRIKDFEQTPNFPGDPTEGELSDLLELELQLHPESELKNGINNININENTFYTIVYGLPKNKYNYFQYNIPYSITNILNNNTQLNYCENTTKPINKYYVETKDIYNKNFQSHKELRKIEAELLNNENIKYLENEISERSFTRSNIILPSKTKYFNIYRTDSNKDDVVKGELLDYSTQHAYYYIDTEYLSKTETSKDVLINRIKELGEFFEKNNEIMNKKFGSINDTDKNGKLIYFFVDLKEELFGYFYGVDKHSKSIYSNSNEGDILYVSLDILDTLWDSSDNYKEDLKATMVHELQHMILYDHRTNNKLNITDEWINEGLSMLTEYYTGVILPHSKYIIKFFENTPNTQLKSLTDFSDITSYSLSLLFFEYLDYRFGDKKSLNNPEKPLFIEKIYNSKYSGIKAIEEATGVQFNQLYVDFIQAILLSCSVKPTDNIYNDKKYNVTLFNDESRSGYNLRNIINNAYSGIQSTNNKYHQVNTKDTYNDLKPYSFILTKWDFKPTSFNFNKTSNVFGSYAEINQSTSTK